MPELPEVETVRRTLRKHVVGKTIRDVEVFLPRLVRQPDVETFRLRLQGKPILEVGRRGKYLLLQVPPYTLVVHLRMEGKFMVCPPEVPVEKHTHLLFHFLEGTQLRYKDVRQFGTFDLVPENDFSSIPGLAGLGPEPLSEEFTFSRFEEILKQPTTRNIKAFLLDQTKIAGLGNIYVDEALFRAGIHPARTVGSLGSRERKRLYESIQQTIAEGIEAGGASVRTYRNGDGEMGYFQLRIQVYGRKGQPCNRCGTLIERIRVAGRGTHVCPCCQPLPPVHKKS